MPEIVIKYKTRKTLDMLRDFAKHFGFSISFPNDKQKKVSSINGVKIIPGNADINVSDLETVFSNKNIDARTLRNQTWQRAK